MKEIRAHALKVDAPVQPDYWLNGACIDMANAGQVTLSVDLLNLHEREVAEPPES